MCKNIRLTTGLTLLMLTLPIGAENEGGHSWVTTHPQWLVSTNMLTDIWRVPSLGMEYAFDYRWSALLYVAWMPLYQSSQHYVRMFHEQSEIHYWPRYVYSGFFFGPSIGLRLFNMGGMPMFHTSDARTQGSLWSVGCSLGWHFNLGCHWGLEPSLTVGYAYADYNRYDAPRDIRVRRRSYAHYFGPTALALRLTYDIKK